MLNPDLTVNSAHQAVGDADFESTEVITQGSVIAELRREHQELITKLGTESVIKANERSESGFDCIDRRRFSEFDEFWKVQIELGDALDALTKDLFDGCTFKSPSGIIRATDEAVLNALNGTNYCSDGDVHVQIASSRDAICSVTSQPNVGITLEEAMEYLGSNWVMYRDEANDTRGMGMYGFKQPENPDTWFAFYSEDSPSFGTISLDNTDRAAQRAEIKRKELRERMWF
jgi:hypothetical protein